MSSPILFKSSGRIRSIRNVVLLYACVATAMFMLCLPLSAQTPSPNVPAGSTSSSMGQDDSTSVAPVAGASNTLTAQQIIRVLQERPEAVIEVKQLVATQMQAQGFNIQPDSITDEELYNQISTSQPLRVAVTNLLRERGYVSGNNTQPNATGDASNDRDQNRDQTGSDSSQPAQTMQSLSQVPGANVPLAASTESSSSQDDMLSDSQRTGLQGRNMPESSPAPSTTSPQTNTNTSRNNNTENTTDIPKVLRKRAPYNLRSMRDLYTQIPEENRNLKRFGSEVFVSHSNSIAASGSTNSPATATQQRPLDIPLGPDYVVGPGDSLNIDLWGGISQTLTRVIDRDGRVSLPESGMLEVAGLTLERTQALIGNVLKQQYRNAQVAVTVSRLRSVRVYVVGDVQRPGAYDISSLSTPLNALYAAGGPTAIGSLRTLRHYRGKELVAEIDLYDFLLHGVRTGDDRFQGGDTLLVPPAGPQVAIFGAVKRPAIYELKKESNLAEVLEDAGGATVAAALGHITVERIDANQRRETLTLPLTSAAAGDDTTASMSAFVVKDGDRIRLAPILPFSERAVYLEGHVVRPGRLAYHDGMRLNEVLHSYQDLLPEPAAKGEIVRLVAPDLHAETIEFDVAEALIGNDSFELRPFDTIRVRGRYDADAPKVTIRGEVLRPGSFPLSQGMTAAQLVRMAGGFRRGALRQDADLTSYQIVDGNRVIGQHSTVRIEDAVTRSDPSADVELKPGDILTIHQITGWKDIGASISVEGEAKHPGSYGFQEGERLSSVLRRAGGFRDTAYPAGAVLKRQQVRELEEKSRDELIRQIEASSAAAKLSPGLSSGDASSTLQIIQQQQDQVLARLRTQPVSGRLVIHITADIDSWANTDADIEVRSGDTLEIPKRPGFVLVSGQVYNPSAITFVPGKSASWYLQRAGGSSELASRKEIFIIRANGTVVGRHSEGGHVLSARLDAGDVVVVPQKIKGISQLWRNLLTTAQLASSITLTAALAGL